MSDRLFVLDTNIVLALVRGGQLGTYLDQTFGLRAAKERPLISLVTHGEIRVLAHRNSWGEKKLAVLEIALNNLVTIDINHLAVLDAYVEIDLYSQKHPDGSRNMGKNDLWIAACAKAAGAILLTTDQDFDHLSPELLEVERVDPDAGKDRNA
ncbi:MAG: type II toxin-antitoxin system VapC family toxin [Deltaproteobacteria bacterium]|nr:type II toxin-antitoxin system VapC family toxin [Deltaproteobacteria bacterium]